MSNKIVESAGKVLPPNAGKGRPKGVPNRLTREAKDAIASVFEELGGIEHMLAWARRNPEAFYTKLYAKLIPLQVSGHHAVQYEVTSTPAEARAKVREYIRKNFESAG